MSAGCGGVRAWARLVRCRRAEGVPFRQSGVLWTDLTPKPSYQTFRDTVRRLNARAVDCSLFTGGTGFSTK